MAMWPATLPAPSINSFQETPPDNLIRSNMDKGPAKVRRRTTANVRPIQFTLMLTEAQVAILDTFFNTTVFGGAEEFDYTHPRTGDAVSARFVSPPQYMEKEGVVYGASISLEIMP